MFDWEQIELKAEDIATTFDADVLIYNGDVGRGNDHDLIRLCLERKSKRENVFLVLVTPGGDADAAYRIGRCLQRSYAKFFVYVSGWCKSAGTLIVIGAHELFIGPFGELGPIDVQRGKQDELWESSSGLTEDSALETLENTAFKMFKDYLFAIKGLSQGRVTFKTAAEVAAKFVTGQLEPVYAQIDPLKIGENSRAMTIAIDYGMRLNLHSGNLKSRNSLRKLASAYSSHGFVIDRKEAEELFSVVKEPTEPLEALCLAMGDGAHFPMGENDETIIRFVSKEPKNEAKQQSAQEERESPEDDGRDLRRADGSTADGAGEVVAFRPTGTEAEGSPQ